MGTFAENLKCVEERMAAACSRAGRDIETVRLVAIAKRFGPDRVVEAAEVGQVLIGENRVQEAMQKVRMCPSSLEWHMVGHLQRNKVRHAVEMFSMIHSVDSWRLIESIEAACVSVGSTMPVCLEVNVSGEGSKYGLQPGEVPDILEQCGSLTHVDVNGVMTMPPFTEDPEGARAHFRRLRELRDTWREDKGFELPELSMGMSHDFEVAIEEGATYIRLGTVLFGDRD